LCRSPMGATVPGGEKFLEPAMRQVGVMALEPAVEPHAVLAGLDRPRFDWRSLRHCTSGLGRLRHGDGPCTVPIPGYIASNSPGRGWSPPEPPMANDSYRIL